MSPVNVGQVTDLLNAIICFKNRLNSRLVLSVEKDHYDEPSKMTVRHNQEFVNV